METFLAIVILTAIVSFSIFGKSAISEIEEWVKDEDGNENKKPK